MSGGDPSPSRPFGPAPPGEEHQLLANAVVVAVRGDPRRDRVLVPALAGARCLEDRRPVLDKVDVDAIDRDPVEGVLLQYPERVQIAADVRRGRDRPQAAEARDLHAALANAEHHPAGEVLGATGADADARLAARGAGDSQDADGVVDDLPCHGHVDARWQLAADAIADLGPDRPPAPG